MYNGKYEILIQNGDKMNISTISKSDSVDNSDIMTEIEASTRKLASIQRIVSISPIPGADRIVVAQVLGWQCVIKKDEFKVGDLVVYFEVDSILPQKPEFEFLRERKFRIRTIKLKKQISQGLIMPLSILPPDIKMKEGDDVTTILGVIKHDPEGKAEQALIEKEKRGPVMRFLMGITLFRKVYLKLNTTIKGNWPIDLCGSKTDEQRIQTIAKYLMEHYDEEWYISEKCDGQSGTFFTYYKKVWGRTKKCFSCCSRNIWLKTKNNSNYWKIADQLELEKKLKGLEDLYSIQGEICGEGIQGNKYKIKGIDLYVFNVIKNGTRLSLNDVITFCEDNGLKFVPIVDECFVPAKEIGENKTVQEVVNYMVELSKGKSKLFDRTREGIVCRVKTNPLISLKVINPDFLLEEED